MLSLCVGGAGVLDLFFFFSSRRRHTRFDCDWSSDVCSSDLRAQRISNSSVIPPYSRRVGTGRSLPNPAIRAITSGARSGFQSWAVKTMATPPIIPPRSLSVKNRLDEVKFRCFPVKRTLRRQECSPRRSGGERTVYLSCSTKRFPPSCCFASRRQRSNETDAGRPVQRKLLAAGPANHTGGSRNRHGGDWLPGRPQGEGFRNPESGFCDRCGDVLRV